MWQETVAPPAMDGGSVVSAAESRRSPVQRRRRPPPLTLVRRWASALLLVAGAIILIGRQLTAPTAGWSPLPLPVPMQGQNGGETGRGAGPSSSGARDAASITAAGAAARSGLSAAVHAGTVRPSEAAAAAKVISRAEAKLAADGTASGGDLGTALAEIAAQAPAYTSPRVHVLFPQLAVNLDRRPPAVGSTDITGPDGTVYRYMAGHGYVFHPLADFGRLNRYVAQNDKLKARQLADALLARAVKQRQALVWEYYFPFGGGPSRWTSGFAQAVAADALYRAGLLLHDESLRTAAHAAFAGLATGLTRPAGGGKWVVEYSNSDILVLNAHLESLLALQRYAKQSGDPDAAALAQQFNHAAHALLPSFDTGCWSRYSLNGQPASAGYHSYHVELLRRLYATTHDPLWQQTAARWDGYQRNPSC